MKQKTMLGGAFSIAVVVAIGAWLAATHGAPSPALAAGTGTQALVDRAFAGPAGPDDEGQYRLIDPIGPGGATATSATDEVFASTMVGGLYTKWRPYHDPFSTTGGYDHRGLGLGVP